MYDPKKYDKTGSSKSVADLIDEREKIIRYISDHRQTIVEECEKLDNYIEKNPEGKAVEPFREKLDGWSRILNGLDIVKRMYEVV